MKRYYLPAFFFAVIGALIILQFVSCGGGGGGDASAPGGGIGTGADSVTVFWLHYGAGFGGGSSVQETGDGGFIVAGYDVPGQSAPADMYVTKTDAQGAVQWQKWFGGTGWDSGQSVRQTADNGYIVGGCVDCDADPRRFYLLKLDGSGNKAWDRTIAGASLSGAYAVRETRSGANPDGYALVGSDMHQGVALIKTGPTGTVLWQQSFASHTAWDVGFAVEQTTDEGYAIAGVYGGGIGLIKTGASGSVQWIKNFGPGEGWSVKETADGGYVIAGRTTPSPWFGGTVQGDAVVVKTDKDGNQVWRKTFGGAEDDEARSVALTLDGGYIIAGKTLSYGPGPVDHSQPWQWEDVFLIRLDANGNTVWQKVKGHRPNGSDGGASVSAVSDGGYIVAGNSNAYENGTVLLMKTDKNGDTVNLGEQDLTITVPGTIGSINFTNAVDIASAGAKGITLPHDAGSTALTILIDAANGTAPSAFCDGGGSYSATLVPSGPVQGSVLSVTFIDCVNGPSGDQRTLNGSFTLTVESISGSFSSDYTVQTTVSSISITSVESGGALTNSTTGGTRFRRQSISGNYADLSQSITIPSPVALTNSETSGGVTRTRVVGPFAAVTDSVTSSGTGAYSFGLAGETVMVDPGTISGALTVTVLQPVQGAGPGGAPGSGSFRIVAQDNSRITATVTGAVVTLAVDTNADGADDGTITTTWDFLY